jgi:hypothetical protein
VINELGESEIMDLLLEIIEVILISIFTAIICRILIHRVRQSAIKEEDSGRYVIEYGGAIRKFALGCAIGLGALFVGIAIFYQSSLALTLIFSMIGLYLILILPLFIEAYGTRFIVTKEGISKQSPWSKNFFARWDEMREIKYNRQSGGYVIKTMTGKLRLDPFLSGLPRLLLDANKRIYQGGVVLPFRCKKCGTNLRIDGLSDKGRLNKCPSCGKTIDPLDYPAPLGIFMDKRESG